MNSHQKQTLLTLSETQLHYMVEGEVIVIDEVEAGVKWNIYIIHPNGRYYTIHYKGRSDKIDQLAISGALRFASRRTKMARNVEKEIREIEANLPETITCLYCQKEIKRSGFSAHEKTKTHLANLEAYKIAHPEKFEKKSEGESKKDTPTPEKATSKTKKPAKGKPKTERGAIGKYCLELLHNKALADKTYAELAEMVRAKFDSKTSPACIAWYVSQNKNDKTLVPRKKAKKEKKAKKVEPNPTPKGKTETKS